jgi:hypothetical protein
VKTHDQLVKRLMRRTGVRAEVQRVEREAAELLGALLKARQEAGLTRHNEPRGLTPCSESTPTMERVDM